MSLRPVFVGDFVQADKFDLHPVKRPDNSVGITFLYTWIESIKAETITNKKEFV